MEIWERQYEVLADVLSERGVDVEAVKASLKRQVIELPSWAVGNSGTRYGVFPRGWRGPRYLGQDRRLRRNPARGRRLPGHGQPCARGM